MAIASLVVPGLGEITRAPGNYEYVSRLAAPGQEGLFMGHAFLPIAIGYFITGPLGGWLVHCFGEVRGRPEQLWYVVAGIGLSTTLLMVAYDRIVRPGLPGRLT